MHSLFGDAGTSEGVVDAGTSEGMVQQVRAQKLGRGKDHTYV